MSDAFGHEISRRDGSHADDCYVKARRKAVSLPLDCSVSHPLCEPAGSFSRSLRVELVIEQAADTVTPLPRSAMLI